ncbi:MAG: hypothetical protein ACRCR2_03775 [Fusobacteriaceae bacterium]
MGEKLDAIKASVDIISGFFTFIMQGLETITEFVIDPFTTLRTIADPLILVTLTVIILLKAFGFKGVDKYAKISFLIYLIILLF